MEWPGIELAIDLSITSLTINHYTTEPPVVDIVDRIQFMSCRLRQYLFSVEQGVSLPSHVAFL